ncbi:hypothetical protein E4U14_005537 [Claviceps sp. LM454 group G7]|nr:hypothetical protein E4U14_005537 [Claviceps sp. LM454 group G7]
MLEVLVGGASECCPSFYDTDGPQELGVLHGSEGDVGATGALGRGPRPIQLPPSSRRE